MKGTQVKHIAVILSLSLASAFILTGLIVRSQTNVILTSVSPGTGQEGTAVAINGSNLLQCSPLDGSARCNVQFFDTDSRRTTISGTEVSDTRVNAVVPQLCPGDYMVRVGEVLDHSNDVPFDYVDLTAQATNDQSVFYCRYISSITPVNGIGGISVIIRGRNLHTTVRFYRGGNQVITATGTVNTTYPVELFGGQTGTFISQITFTLPTTLAAADYKVRVGTNQMVTVNTGSPVQVSDISNAVDFRVDGQDTNAPSISNVRVVNITQSSATVLWTTDEPADSQVEYCLTGTRCGTNSSLNSSLVTEHSVNLSGLSNNTYYYYWVKSRDNAGNLRSRGYFLFRTSAQVTPTPTPTPSRTPTPTPPQEESTPPILSNLQVVNIGRFTATVTWDTNEPADSKVFLCAFRFLCFTLIGSNTALTTSHSVDISGLSPNRYQFIVASSTDAAGNRGVSNIVSFLTEAGLLITNLRAENVGSTEFTIAWDTNYPSDSRLVYCNIIVFCYFAGSVSDAAMVTNHSLTITGLRPDTNYYYKVTSRDELGYSASGAFLNLRTQP